MPAEQPKAHGIPLWAMLAAGCVVIVAITAFGYLQLVGEEPADPQPAPTAPDDLCAVVGEDLVAQLLPGELRLGETGNYSEGPDASCAYDSATDDGGYGHVNMRLLRYGESDGVDGVTRADETFGDGCDAAISNIESTAQPGLGEEACIAAAEDSSGTAHGDVVVRRGADLIWVNYWVNPGSASDAEEAVLGLAEKLLSGT
jgi:hypothetical protein